MEDASPDRRIGVPPPASFNTEVVTLLAAMQYHRREKASFASGRNTGRRPAGEKFYERRVRRTRGSKASTSACLTTPEVGVIVLAAAQAVP